MGQQRRPNIVLVVLNSCRADFAHDYASVVSELGEGNLCFEHAIAPAPWSLPSHASLFTGELPHQHGDYRLNDSIDHDLVSVLSDNGYTSYGASANGFASQRTGFHDPFDDFRFTGGREPFLEGLDVSGTLQELSRGEATMYRDAVGMLIRALARERYPVKSLFNYSQRIITSLSEFEFCEVETGS